MSPQTCPGTSLKAVLVPLFLKLKRLTSWNKLQHKTRDPEKSTASKETREKLTSPYAPNHLGDLRPLEWNTTASREDVQMKEDSLLLRGAQALLSEGVVWTDGRKEKELTLSPGDLSDKGNQR